MEKHEMYASLAEVLNRAYKQASEGKGVERHAKEGEAFEDQLLFRIAEKHGVGFLTGQAVKKLDESARLFDDFGTDAAVRELLGAIVYTAAAVIALEADGNVGIASHYISVKEVKENEETCTLGCEDCDPKDCPLIEESMKNLLECLLIRK